MRASVITGCALQDYVELTPETLGELANLLQVSQSRFLPKDFVELRTETLGPESSHCTAMLRIYFGPKRRKQFGLKTGDALDATP